jgi:hypothetical protein
MARDCGALIPNESCNWLPAVGNDESSLLHAVKVAVHAAIRRESAVPFAHEVTGCLKLPPPEKCLHKFFIAIKNLVSK